MTAPAKYSVGQRVWVYSGTRRSGGPDEGTVTKVGRKLVTVRFARSREEQFRIDTGQLNDRQYPSHYSIRTEQERLNADREAVLHAEMREAGVDFRIGFRPSLALLEDLAAAVRRHAG